MLKILESHVFSGSLRKGTAPVRWNQQGSSFKLLAQKKGNLGRAKQRDFYGFPYKEPRQKARPKAAAAAAPALTPQSAAAAQRPAARQQSQPRSARSHAGRRHPLREGERQSSARNRRRFDPEELPGKGGKCFRALRPREGGEGFPRVRSAGSRVGAARLPSGCFGFLRKGIKTCPPTPPRGS